MVVSALSVFSLVPLLCSSLPVAAGTHHPAGEARVGDPEDPSAAAGGGHEDPAGPARGVSAGGIAKPSGGWRMSLPLLI